MIHHHVYRTELTPVSFLQRNAYVFPDKTAVIHGSRRYSYRQLEERVNRLASSLRKAGLKKHDRVAFICPNIPAMLEAHYGVPLAGGILVAVNIRLSSDEIGYILKHSGSIPTKISWPRAAPPPCPPSSRTKKRPSPSTTPQGPRAGPRA